MSQRMHTTASKAGLPPGTLIHVGETYLEKTAVTVIDYDADRVEEHTILDPGECQAYVGNRTVSWVNVTGLHDVAAIGSIGQVFGLHALMLEDILHTAQRPRTEDHGSLLFVVLKMLYRREEGIVAEQVSFVLGKGFVLTFQETEGDVFDMIRERIRKGQGRLRTMGADYLMYALIDAIVDNYFVIIEELEDSIEALQEKVFARPGPRILHNLHDCKRDIVFLRRSLWPVRELVANLEKSETPMLSQALRPYLRDVYEHAIQVIDSLDSLRELLTSAMDIHMTSLSNRMNEVMKMLTLISTIFIPLTFVVGVYGMNFEYMPELRWRYGYVGAWGVMLMVALAMGLYFKRKKWM